MFLENHGTNEVNKEIFRPKMLGDFSSSVKGNLVMHGEEPEAVERDFQLNYVMDNERQKVRDRELRKQRMKIN
jgi:hypothetical protein